MNHHKYYLSLAEVASKASKCLSSHWGVIIVKNDMILGVGYNGPARGVKHCNPCKRDGMKPGEGYNLCAAVHAEVNGIIQSGGRERCIGSTLYIASHNRKWNHNLVYNTKLGNFPCNNCTRLIVNAGIEWVIQREISLAGEEIIVPYNIPQLIAEGKIE